MLAEPGDYKKIEENIQWFIQYSKTKEIEEMGRRGHEYLLKKLRKEMSIDEYTKAIADC